MNLLKSVREKFGGKPVSLQEEDLSGFNAPDLFSILMERARELYLESSYFSISLLQERFDITYFTAANVMEQLDEEGLFGEEEEEVVEWEGDL